MNTSTNHPWNFDPIDKMIFEDGIKIVSVFFHKELDEDLSLRGFLKEEMLKA
jgi:hypothetical protein